MLLIGDFALSWRRIRLEALQQTPESFGSSYEEEVGYSESDWNLRLSKNDIFGAFVDDTPVGVTGFCALDTLKTNHRGILFAMYITPKYRG